MIYQMNDGKVETRFENDDYIPMNIRFGKEDLDVDRMGLYGPDGELLEIASSMMTHEIRELTLVHCGGYRLAGRKIAPPSAISGILAIKMPEHADVPRFELEIFSDGLRFKLGADASEYLQCGAVVFGFSKVQDAITEVYVLDLSADKIAGLVETLDYHIGQKDTVLTFADVRGD